jgi:hypothetical protein
MAISFLDPAVQVSVSAVPSNNFLAALVEASQPFPLRPALHSLLAVYFSAASFHVSTASNAHLKVLFQQVWWIRSM